MAIVSCRSACSLALSLYCFFLSSGRVRYLLWLSCLSLVVVLCFSDSFVFFCFPVCLSFHSALTLLVSPWCSLFVLVGYSDFSSTSVGVHLDIGFVFSFLCFSCLPFFRSFHFRSPTVFLPFRLFCFTRLCVTACSSLFFFSPFGSFALASELRCLPCVSLLR